MKDYPGIEKALNDGLEIRMSSTFFNLRRIELYVPNTPNVEIYGEGYTLSEAMTTASECYRKKQKPLEIPYLLHMKKCKKTEDYIDCLLINGIKVKGWKEAVFIRLEAAIDGKKSISVTGNSFSDAYNNLDSIGIPLPIFLQTL